MAKRLLIMALVAMQSASSGGASLFFCFGADGSVCIDGGPSVCSCCSGEHGEAGGDDDYVADCCHQQHVSAAGVSQQCACHENRRCADHLAMDAAIPDNDVQSDQVTPLVPCDCTHVQVSQGPTIVHRSDLVCGIKRAAEAASWLPAGLSVLPRTTELGAPLRIPLPRGPALALLTVSVAVRIC